MECVSTLQEAIDMVTKEKKLEQVIVLPKAVNIIPHFADN